MSHRQCIEEDIPRHQSNKRKRPFVCRYNETTQLLPFMQEMLDSAVLKMKSNNKQQNHVLVAQSIHLINKTLINMYKLNNIEIQVLIQHFLQELSYQFMQQQKQKPIKIPSITPLLPFMKQMLDSIILKMIPNNKQNNHLLISQSIHLINKTLSNKLTRNEIQSLIRQFLQELSIRYQKKNASIGQHIPVKTDLLPFMYDLLDNVVFRMTPTNSQNNQRLISETIFVINKRLVNKLNRDEIQSLIRSFLEELSNRFIKKTNECIDKPVHDCIDTDTIEEEPICLPIQEKVSKPGFFNNLTITIPNELCKFLL